MRSDIKLSLFYDFYLAHHTIILHVIILYIIQYNLYTYNNVRRLDERAFEFALRYFFLFFNIRRRRIMSCCRCEAIKISYIFFIIIILLSYITISFSNDSDRAFKSLREKTDDGPSLLRASPKFIAHNNRREYLFMYYYTSM